MGYGWLKVRVFTADEALPVSGAKVTIQQDGLADEVLYTDTVGMTVSVSLAAPPTELSFDSVSEALPYSLCDVIVQAEGFQSTLIRGVQTFEGIESELPVDLEEMAENARNKEQMTVVDIPPNALREPSVEQEGPPSTRVLTKVFIPEAVIVHLGAPSANVRNVKVPFTDYIKNVCCSEIYPTWPDAAIRANIHVQVGFTLNRIFTEWYPNRGYSFNITSSPAYDQYFVEGRNIFDNISTIVDQIFNQYPRRFGYTEPLFSSYCSGTTVTCSGLSQWGSSSLAQSGYTPIRILRYYYGNNVELAKTNDIQSIQSSYPGTLLRMGSRSDAVRTIQRQLNRIRINYPAIPVIPAVDGIYGKYTEAAVKTFQKVFNLSADGIVGPATWNKISYVYTAVKRLADLNSEGEKYYGDVVAYPGTLLKTGSRGTYVTVLQQYLSDLSPIYPSIPSIAVDGIFGSRTAEAVRAFQRQFDLSPDGIVGPLTWNKLTQVWADIYKG